MENKNAIENYICHWEEIRQKWPIKRLRKLTKKEFGESCWTENRNTFCCSVRLFYLNTLLLRFEDLSKIIEIAEASAAGDLEEIDKIEMDEEEKWKIAFLYQPSIQNLIIVPVFSTSYIRRELASKFRELASNRPALYRALSKKYGTPETMFNFIIYPYYRVARTPKIWLWAPCSSNGGKKKYEDIWNIAKKESLMFTSEEKRFYLEGEFHSFSRNASKDSYIFDFIFEIKAGDYVLVKKGGTEIIALGQVASDYFYDDSSEVAEKVKFYYFRKVKWLQEFYIDIEDFCDNCALPPALLLDVSKKDNYTNLLSDLLSDISAGEDVSEIMMEISPKIQDVIEIFEKNHNIILHGAPGTGKTYLAKQIAKAMGAGTDEICFVQFHPSYDYTDFVEGLRPISDGNGQIGFERKDGIFKEFCKKAIEKSEKKFIFIIDEINRGEVSKIFGELFFSIDPGYRGEEGKVKTQYQNLVPAGDTFANGFFVPENVYIIGTMNDIDRSVESMDFAFRRRFAWKEISADENLEMLDGNAWSEDAKICLKNLNAEIEKDDELGKSFQIGPAYFKKLKDYEGDFEKLWKFHLEGLLREYLRGRSDAEKKLVELKKAFDQETESAPENSVPAGDEE